MKPPRDTTPCYPCSAWPFSIWLDRQLDQTLPFWSQGKAKTWGQGSTSHLLSSESPMPSGWMGTNISRAHQELTPIHLESSPETVTILHDLLPSITAITYKLYELFLSLFSRLCLDHFQQYAHYILLNDCHAPWSSLCHLSPRCPWTTAWVKSHSNDRTTLYQRDKS